MSVEAHARSEVVESPVVLLKRVRDPAADFLDLGGIEGEYLAGQEWSRSQERLGPAAHHARIGAASIGHVSRVRAPK